MKNWYGLLGNPRNQFHQNIHGIISDFALMMKPTLVIADGRKLLMRNGPTGGSLNDVKKSDTIVVGTDCVGSVDSWCVTRLLEKQRPRDHLPRQGDHPEASARTGGLSGPQRGDGVSMILPSKKTRSLRNRRPFSLMVPRDTGLRVSISRGVSAALHR